MDEIKTLRQYHALSQQMHEARDYNGAEGLLHDVALMEEALLQKFGLPNTLAFSELFQELGWRKSVSTDDLMQFTNELKARAAEHLLTNPLSDVELLKAGREVRSTVQDTLAMMGLSCNSYQSFVYEMKWLRKKLPPSAILKEVKSAELFSIIFMEAFTKKDFQYLESKLPADHGLRFLNEFIGGHRDIIQEQEFSNQIADTEVADEYDHQPHLLLNEYYISHIQAIDRNRFRIEIVASVNSLWLRLQVLLTAEMLFRLLESCINYELAALVRSQVSATISGSPLGGDELDIYHCYDCLLGCTAAIVIAQLWDEDDEEDSEPVTKYIYYLNQLL